MSKSLTKRIVRKGLSIASLIGSYLPLSGGRMTGDIQSGGYGFSNPIGNILLKSSTGVISFLHLISGVYSSIIINSTTPRSFYLQDKDYWLAGLDDIKNNYFFAGSDETSNLVASGATPVFTDYLPYAISVSAVMINVNTAPTGANIIVDIKKNGTTIFTTPISIDATENTSLTAATPYVLNGAISFAQGDKIEAFVTQVGSTVAGKGLKVKILD